MDENFDLKQLKCIDKEYNKKFKSVKVRRMNKEHPYFSLTMLSIEPGLKLCDVTGLPAPYTDPKSQLRFFNSDTYSFIRNIGYDEVERYFENGNYLREQ